VIRNRDELVGDREDCSGDRDVSADSPARDLALDCVAAGIRSASPRRAVRETVELRDEATFTIAGETFDLGDYESVVVLGGGKAAVGVAAELESLLGERIDRGVVVTDDAGGGNLEAVAVHEGDHPVPSERGVAGARRVLELADEADDSTLVLAVVTGGGSALLPAPAEGVSLGDLQDTTAQLLESGATIAEINAVRKHCSALKGGRLAERATPASVVGLVLSDVVGNDLGTIASGPLSPDDSTFADALAVLDRYGIDPPSGVGERLERGQRGEIPETPTEDAPAFERVSVHVLADGMTALRGAAAAAREAGYDPLVLSSRVRGEAREAAKTHAAIAEEMEATGNPVEPPAVVLSGGETTVTVRGEGQGGPNLEFALSWALAVESDDATLASVDTDGRDGGTNVAGALVDAGTVGAKVDPEAAREALASNDSLGVLSKGDCVIRTGATGTNVNDLRVLVVPADGD
jgi:hydroxypyruvate reductase